LSGRGAAVPLWPSGHWPETDRFQTIDTTRDLTNPSVRTDSLSGSCACLGQGFESGSLPVRGVDLDAHDGIVLAHPVGCANADRASELAVRSMTPR
jgi:hypothetical protein